MYYGATRKYQAARINVSKTQQIIVLYDSMIRFINLAIEAIKKDDIQERYNMITKTIKILDGLQSSLDHKNGGEVVVLLDNFYSVIYQKLMSMHVNPSTEVLEAIKKDLQGMNESWSQVDIAMSKQKSKTLSDELSSTTNNLNNNIKFTA